MQHASKRPRNPPKPENCMNIFHLSTETNPISKAQRVHNEVTYQDVLCRDTKLRCHSKRLVSTGGALSLRETVKVSSEVFANRYVRFLASLAYYNPQTPNDTRTCGLNKVCSRMRRASEMLAKLAKIRKTA
jgi:hypothetical protein